jgi:hypothetical protein
MAAKPLAYSSSMQIRSFFASGSFAGLMLSLGWYCRDGRRLRQLFSIVADQPYSRPAASSQDAADLVRRSVEGFMKGQSGFRPTPVQLAGELVEAGVLSVANK